MHAYGGVFACYVFGSPVLLMMLHDTRRPCLAHPDRKVGLPAQLLAVFLDLKCGSITIVIFQERDRHDLAFRRDIARDRDARNAWQNQHVPGDRELTTPVHQAREWLAFHRCFNGVTLWGRKSFLMHTMSFRVSGWDGRLSPLFLCTSLQHGQLAGLSFSALALNAESSGQFLSIGVLIAHDFLCVRLGNLDIGMPESAGQVGDRCTGPDHAD